MVKNSFFSLSPDSKERIDMANTIKYTLLLDYHIPELDDKSTFIDRLMKACYQCCIRHFFSDEFITGYNFFGSAPKATPPLYILCEGKLEGSANFQTMILQHCIFSSYHAILTELLNDTTVTSYRIVNNIEKTGIHMLYQKHPLIFENGKKTNLELENYGKHNSSSASTFIKNTKSHINKIPAIMQPMVKAAEDGRDSYKYPLQFCNLCYRICRENASNFNILIDMDEKKFTSKDFLEKVKTLTKNIEPYTKYSKIPEQNFEERDIVDGMYSYYLTERLFNLRLFYSLLQNIRHIEQETSYRLCQKETLAILTCCKKLPNIFTRQYFLKYAFDQIIYMPSSYQDYWHSNDFEKIGSLVSDGRRIPPRQFQFAKWLEQYDLFMNYMAEFVIPLYENCFISMLMDSVESKYSSEEHSFHLIKAMELLADYMKTHYQEILQPIDLAEEMEFLDVISEQKSFSLFENFPAEAMLQIKNELLSSEPNLELNLKILNPDFFKQNPPHGAISNFSRIQKFYIDLIRYTHLEK